MNDRFNIVLEEVEVLLAEAVALAAEGPHLRILHRFRQPGAHCSPGESIAAAWLIYRSREYPIRLSTAMLQLLDYLGRHRRLGQTASQIAIGMRRDPFYAVYDGKTGAVRGRTRRIARSSIKEYVKRIRRALGSAFVDAGLSLDPYRVLVADATTGNEVTYRLRGSVEVAHID